MRLYERMLVIHSINMGVLNWKHVHESLCVGDCACVQLRFVLPNASMCISGFKWICVHR